MTSFEMTMSEAIMLDFEDDREKVKAFFGEDITEERFEEIKFLHGLSREEYEDWQGLMENRHDF